MAANTTEDRVELTAIDKVSAVFDGIENRAKSLGKAYDALKATFIVGAVGGTALAFYNELQAVQLKSEVATNRLIAVLRATGEAAGFSRRELEDYARSLSESTQFSAGAYKAAETNLLKFGNVNGDVFKEALKLSADYAAFTGGDLVDATQSIGKALAAPLEGTRALEREIGKLNFTTKERIETLLREGRVSDAQGVVLDVLRGKIGGTAEVMNSGLLKATKDLDKAWEDLNKTGAKSFSDSGFWTKGLQLTRELLSDIEKSLKGQRNALEDFAREQVLPRVPGASTGVTIAEALLRSGNNGPSVSGRISYPPGASPADQAAQARVATAQQEAAVDRIREAWTKALPIVDSWNLRLLQMNGATEEEIARLQVLDRVVTREGMQFNIRAPHGDIPSGAKVAILNTALQIDERRQKAFQIDTGLKNLEDLRTRMEAVAEAERAMILSFGDANHEIAFQTQLAGEATYAQQQLTAAHTIDVQVQQHLRQIATLYGEDVEGFSAYTERVNAAAQAQKAKLLELLEVQRQVSRQWSTGARDALNEYGDAATNAAANAKEGFTNAFRGMEDALVEFARTGKLNFTSLANSIIADIIRIQMRENVTGPLAGYLGGLNLGALFTGSGYGAGASGAGAFDYVDSGGQVLPEFAGGGVMTSRGPLPLKRYAGGGIADRPQLAMFGEGSGPEAYVPLPDGRRIPVQMSGQSAQGGHTFIIDARGADRSGLAQLQALITRLDGSVEYRAIAAVRRSAALRGRSAAF